MELFSLNHQAPSFLKQLSLSSYLCFAVDATSFRTRIRLELSSAVADNDLVSVAK